ncbi:uncharacterized PKHD-type hydroxylase-like protein, partial [Tanacetum coccineum]
MFYSLNYQNRMNLFHWLLTSKTKEHFVWVGIKCANFYTYGDPIVAIKVLKRESTRKNKLYLKIGLHVRLRVGGGTSDVYKMKCRLLLRPLLPRIEHFMLVTQLIYAEARIDKKRRRVANWVLHREVIATNMLDADINSNGFIRANDICKESKRQTINAEDVFMALEEIDKQGNKPSSHDVITGRWSPSAADRVGYNCGLFCFHMDSGNADRCKEGVPTGLAPSNANYRLRLNPNQDHRADNYEDLGMEFTPLLFSSLERYLPPNLLNVSRDVKYKYMRDILRRYSTDAERTRECLDSGFRVDDDGLNG